MLVWYSSVFAFIENDLVSSETYLKSRHYSSVYNDLETDNSSHILATELQGQQAEAEEVGSSGDSMGAAVGLCIA